MSELNQTPKQFKEVSTDGKIRLNGIHIGIIKANNDAHRMGRLQVFIPELGGDPSNSSSWYMVNYAPPFAGSTPVEKNKKDGKTMPDTQKSYGFWAVPPDLDNEVLCCFVNGDSSMGFWFACLYQENMNHMVPGIALNISTNDEINKLNLPPVCEYNKKDSANESKIDQPKRPVYEPLHNALVAQGLYTDPERGPATTSARREAPSQVYGLSSPRGNNIHIDDDTGNEFIRMRTRSGVQVVIHETTGYIYMISKEGNSWIEISDIGIDMYSKRSISLRGEENINLHADQNVIIHSGGALHHTASNITHRSKGKITSKADGLDKRNSPQIQENSKKTNAPKDTDDKKKDDKAAADKKGKETSDKTKKPIEKGKYYGKDQQCVSLSKYNDPSIGPASGWRAGDKITADNWQDHAGESVATMNHSVGGQKSYDDAGLGGTEGNRTHTGVLSGWDNSAGGPILTDQYKGSGGAMTSTYGSGSKYGSFYTISH
jgi:hypothetical protein